MLPMLLAAVAACAPGARPTSALATEGVFAPSLTPVGLPSLALTGEGVFAPALASAALPALALTSGGVLALALTSDAAPTPTAGGVLALAVTIGKRTKAASAADACIACDDSGRAAARPAYHDVAAENGTGAAPIPAYHAIAAEDRAGAAPNAVDGGVACADSRDRPDRQDESGSGGGRAVAAGPIAALVAPGVGVGYATALPVAAVGYSDALAVSGVPHMVVRFAPPLPADTPVQRPRAIEHSDAYYTRLSIHRIGSYVILPLFAAEYFVGQRLLNEEPTPGGLKGLHAGLAAGVVGVFGLNTVTGVWNLTEDWHDSEGRTRRILHVVSMLAADGGFAATALIRPHRERVFTPGGGIIRTFNSSRATTHKDLAIASISLATASTLMMWLWH